MFSEDDIIYRYTKEDAIADGQQARIGSDKGRTIYITSTILADYEDENKRETLMQKVLESLDKPDPEDTNYLKLRVIEKGKIWAVEDGDGITIMHPSDY